MFFGNMHSISDSPRVMYARAWNKLKPFKEVKKINELLSLRVPDIRNYLADLFDNNFAPSTIAPTAGAEAFGQNLFSYPNPAGSFLLRSF